MCSRGGFDPKDGRFVERVRGLVAQDGELETVLRRAVAGSDSDLAKTLASHVGRDSPLMKMLSPDASEGLLGQLRSTVETQLHAQKSSILQQFTLDQPDSALSKLVRELREGHGELSKDVQKRIDVIVKEFSLDEENSALKRLVDRVDAAQKRIQREFTLDDADSALARMQKSVFELLERERKERESFQRDVIETLGRMQGAKDEAQHGTRHGLTFEKALLQAVEAWTQASGDIASDQSTYTGVIARSRVGDIVVELGPDARVPGARIVLEAKQDASYTLDKARAEIAVARKNRRADIGIFVFSAKSAPLGLKNFQRLGNDIFVVWDADDVRTDIVLESGLAVAKALCLRTPDEPDDEIDLEAFDKAILEIEKRTQNLSSIEKSATAIGNHADSILKRVRTDRERLERSIDRLRVVSRALR